MPQTDTWGQRLLSLASLSSVFAAFLYLIGRTYLETYYSTVGVPASMLKFEWNDYVFAGAHWIGILFAAGFTALAYCLFIVVRDLYQYLRTESTPSTKPTKSMEPNSTDEPISKKQRSKGVNQLIQDPNKWGRMAIVDTKPFMLPVTRHSIFGHTPPATGSPV